MVQLSRFASAAAAAACATMAAAPLSAAELPQLALHAAVATPGVFDADAVNAHQYRYYRRSRTSAGDVIGAVVAIGAIAAVASAVGRANTRTRGGEYRYPDQDYRYDYRNRSYDSRYDDGSRGIDRAVDMCAREVERNARVDTVDGVIRSGNGWTVTGQLRTGEPFTCSIGADGRIDGVDYGGRGAVNDRQWDSDRYAAARAAQDGMVPPIEGQTDDMVGDDRYETAVSPDIDG